ncbi:MAG: ABC transporter ATP-binding protein, partial [Rhodobacteraceae bacterium]|nr:ABC transporter ATP-binding protein [Paracoccaceae bacterium]
LDVETLDLLQELLDDYDGTVLLVSHDRDFLDRVAKTTVVMEGTGTVTVYAGGWSDYQAQKKAIETAGASVKYAPAKSKSSKKAAAKTGLSFTEQHRLEGLPDVMERLEAEIAKLETLLSDPNLYRAAPVKFQKATEALTARQTALAAAEQDWINLEEKLNI